MDDGPDYVIREDALKDVTGYGRSSIWRMIREGRFPKPIPLGPKRKAWLASEIKAWQQERIAKRDAKPKKKT